MLSPGGTMMVSVRRGAGTGGRPMAPGTTDEVAGLAARRGLEVVRTARREDARRRAGVSWRVVRLRLPDDGTAGLPLLRHAVFTERKSSTYKLALVRIRIRIAGRGLRLPSTLGCRRGAPASGARGLYWIRAFRPLLDRGLPQLRRVGASPAFAGDGSHGLAVAVRPDARSGVRRRGCRQPREGAPGGRELHPEAAGQPHDISRKPQARLSLPRAHISTVWRHRPTDQRTEWTQVCRSIQSHTFARLDARPACVCPDPCIRSSARSSCFPLMDTAQCLVAPFIRSAPRLVISTYA